jgi:hypothetical protein
MHGEAMHRDVTVRLGEEEVRELEAVRAELVRMEPMRGWGSGDVVRWCVRECARRVGEREREDGAR